MINWDKQNENYKKDRAIESYSDHLINLEFEKVAENLSKNNIKRGSIKWIFLNYINTVKVIRASKPDSIIRYDFKREYKTNELYEFLRTILVIFAAKIYMFIKK